MPVELTPSGTRGVTMPRIPRPLLAILLPIANVFLRARGMKLLSLTTTGAKSGNEHSVPLGYFPDGDSAWLVVASFGGAVKHPAWYFNLARNPDKIWATVDGRRIRVNAESLAGEARDAAWRRIVAEAPIYSGYERKTDRVIPIVRLTPA
ncbi:MAG: nitroreductase family deazaflavin-dependent oxidoreductase [Chloroflexota bacterium]|nr:MAG: nitroreductase family deazaflavin-dependent oxidoreductase [Chloroflexota bacterium]